ncbi:MAG: acyloxyacyl hydrolase, partial [Prosthecochloris sp.]|uniref:acyloxyacyl hydrolase n=2 Tax=Prosthecochloris TaxID=1101 RepID=UPI00258858AC
PMYLSIETDEQRNPGFNFLNQFGLGMQYKISEKLALNAAYRYRHLSHGGLRDNRNLGMDSFGVVGGISFLY